MSRLTQAAIKGSLEDVKAEISQGADVNETEDVYGRSALHIASDKDDKSIVVELLANGANVNLTDYNGKTPLHLAAEKDNGEIVEFLLENGADEKIKDVSGNTALLTAITHLSYKAGKGFLETDEAHVKEIFDTTSLLIASRNIPEVIIEAASKGRVDIISMLEQNGYNIDVFDKNGDSLLHTAVRAQKVDVVSYLVKKNSGIINTKNTDCVLPIQIVSDRYCLVKKSYEDINIGMILLNTNDDNEVVQIFNRIVGGVCPYWEAAVKGDEQFIKLLLRRKIDKNIQDKNGNTVLHLAALNGHLSIMKSFLKIKPDIYARNKQNQTVLDIALDHKNPKILTCIIESGYNVNELDKTTGKSLLHSLIRHINEESLVKIKMLLKLGADVNLKDSEGRTALNLLFLDDQYDLDLGNPSGDLDLGTPLGDFDLDDPSGDIDLGNPFSHLESFASHLESLSASHLESLSAKIRLEPQLSHIFTLLIRAGADINTQDNHGYTPLHNIIFKYALTGYWPDFIHLITKQCKPDFTIKDNDGLTSLELAHKFGFSKRLLIDENGNINNDFCNSSYENNNIILCNLYKNLIDSQSKNIKTAEEEIERLQKATEIERLQKTTKEEIERLQKITKEEIERLQKKHNEIHTHCFVILMFSAILSSVLSCIPKGLDDRITIFFSCTIFIFFIIYSMRSRRNFEKRAEISKEIEKIKLNATEENEKIKLNAIEENEKFKSYATAEIEKLKSKIRNDTVKLNKFKSNCPIDEHNLDRYIKKYDKYIKMLQSKKSFAYIVVSEKNKREEALRIQRLKEAEALRIQRLKETEALRIQREKEAEDLRNQCPKCGKLGALITSTEYLGEVTRFRSEVKTRMYRYPLWGVDERLQQKQENGIPWGQDVRENVPYQVHKSREIRTCRFCGYRIEGKIIEKVDSPNEKNTTFGMPY